MGLVHCRADVRLQGRVVVFGAGGVIGRSLCDLLHARHVEVLAPASSEFDLLAPGADQAVERILRPDDNVVMLAAWLPRRGRGVDALLANVQMAHAVAAALERRPVAHTVYASSDVVYPLRHGVIEEDSRIRVDTPYGAMHVAREVMFRDVTAGPLAVLRISQVCAPFDVHLAYGPNRFLRTARDDGVISLFGRGEDTRDHIMVSDVAEIIFRSVAHASDGLLNVATGRSLRFSEVAEICASQFHPPPRIEHVARTVPVVDRRFDVTALREAFPDFSPRRLEDGIREIAALETEGGDPGPG